MQAYHQLEAEFKSRNIRFTKPRRAIFKCLQTATYPLSIRDIYTSLPNIDRTSIYRTLELYLSLGVVQIIPIGWKQKYELAEPYAPHHHHFICLKCGSHTDINPPGLEDLLRHYERTAGVIITAHTFELSGVCAACQQGIQ
ncbi:transcriptional repressor [Candidatus Saccharibacteria bacterium]|nr:transcriptional repressor [Candidatus Saccharibacteria bacterium]